MTSDFDAFASQWNEFRKTPSPALPLFSPFLSGRVLDAGCGNGRNARAVASRIDSVTAMDSSPEMLSFAEKNLVASRNASTRLGRLEDLPFEAASFDAVLCLAALHHVKPEDHAKVFAGFHRVLAPDGFLCVAVWNRLQTRFASKPKELDVPWTGHSRYYYFFDESELVSLAKSAGFSVVDVFYEKNGVRVLGSGGQNLCLVAKR